MVVVLFNTFIECLPGVSFQFNDEYEYEFLMILIGINDYKYIITV